MGKYENSIGDHNFPCITPFKKMDFCTGYVYIYIYIWAIEASSGKANSDPKANCGKANSSNHLTRYMWAMEASRGKANSGPKANCGKANSNNHLTRYIWAMEAGSGKANIGRPTAARRPSAASQLRQSQQQQPSNPTYTHT